MAHSDAYNEILRNGGGDRGSISEASSSVSHSSSNGDFYFEPPAVEAVPRGRSTSRRRRSSYGGFSAGDSFRTGHSVGELFGNISPERWVDIVCIPITIAGLVFIVLNFETVLEALFLFLYPVIETVLFIAVLAAIVIGLFLLLRRRRRYYW